MLKKINYVFICNNAFMYSALLVLSSVHASHNNAIANLNQSIKQFTKNLDQYYKAKAAYERAQKTELDQNNFNLPDSDFSNLPDEDLCNLPDNDEPSNVSFVSSELFDISNLPCQPNNPLKKMNKAVPPVSLSFTTSLLIRLFYRGEMFDADGYHSIPVGLMYNMLKYGKVYFEKGKNSGAQMYVAYGLLYSIKEITKKNKIVDRKEVVQARVITERTKYIDDVIFRVGLENFKKHKYDIKKTIGLKKYKNLKTNCLKLDSLLLPEEKNTLWNHVYSRKCKNKSVFIDINCRVNTVPLINMIKIYGPYFKKKLEEGYNNRQDELLVFPCPNKSFFVTTNSSITGASMVYA